MDGARPLLEEDIALANIAQDEIGHAVLWYGARAGIDGSDPDELAYFRDVDGFRNARLVELPRGDWAFTMLRQFLFDAYEAAFTAAAAASTYLPLAEASAKVRTEEVFHLRHSALWVERLGRGTDESARRSREALARLWPYLPQLFEPLPGDRALCEAGILPDPETVASQARARILAQLARSGLTPPELPPNPGGRECHGEALVGLLLEMQAVARADPDASAW